MNQPTHAWLAVEAYKLIKVEGATPDGQKIKLDKLAELLGRYLHEVVVGAWLPDALIKDMIYGHVFKNSVYKGEEKSRFILTMNELQGFLAKEKCIPTKVFPLVDKEWWSAPYRVKQNGGHLPARVIAITQTIRDMLRMGNDDVVRLTGIKRKGKPIVSSGLLYSPRNIATMMWILSHYIADAHMPFHSDNRGLGSTSKQKTHSEIESLWGEQVPPLFDDDKVLDFNTDVENALMPPGSMFRNLVLPSKIPPLKTKDPWLEAVYICRASFAVSFVWVPASVAPVDDQSTKVSLNDILCDDRCCGQDKFWHISQCLMTDAILSIAMFWKDAWIRFVKPQSDT